jgi:tRNA(Ile)-lysidine synthetase-like protein
MPRPDRQALTRRVISQIPPAVDTSGSVHPVLWVAVSGGRDSMALLHCLTSAGETLENLGWALRAVHIDHGIRSARESLADIDLLLSFCSAVGVPLLVYRQSYGVIGELAIELGGTESAARMLRYRIFADIAGPHDLILTAHHADDSREQMLLSYFQGHVPAALEGISPHFPGGIRPFLSCEPPVDRREIENYIDNQDIPFCDDSSNDDPGFRRNFIRKELLPLLQKHMGNVPASLDRLSARWRQAQAGDRVAGLSAEANPSALEFSSDQTWRRGGIFGSQSFSADMMIVSRLGPEARRRSLLDSLPRQLGRDPRIPAEVIDNGFSILLNQSRKGAETELTQLGYGLMMTRWAGEICLLPSLAELPKKGYFSELKPGAAVKLDLLPGLSLGLSVRISDFETEIPPLAVVNYSAWFSGTKFLNSPGKSWYLTYYPEGSGEPAPRWMLDILPVITADSRPVGMVLPETHRWSFFSISAEKETWGVESAESALENKIDFEVEQYW